MRRRSFAWRCYGGHADAQYQVDFFFGKVYRDPEVRPVTRAVFQRRCTSSQHPLPVARADAPHAPDGKGHSSHDITHIVRFFFRKRISAHDLATITCPCLVLNGGDDHVSPLNAAEEWRGALTSGAQRLGN